MQKIAIIPISETGSDIASILQHQLNAKTIQRTQVSAKWNHFDAFIFIGAMGICVRTIAPLVEDKHKDPAVVCVDSLGQHVIAVLSGHVGGANDLTHQVASILGADPVITTQSDNAGLWALDTFEQRFDWPIASEVEDMNDCIFAFVNRQPTALLMDVRDEGTDYLEKTLPDHVTLINDIKDATPDQYKLLIIVSPISHTYPDNMLVLHFVPMVGTIGFGLAHHPEDYEYIYDEIAEAMANIGILPCAHRYCTIDVKADELFVKDLQELYQEEVVFFTADELAKVDVPNPSTTVEKHVGTPSVCEAAAILGSHHGKLIVPKIKGKNWTAALAIDEKYLRTQKGHIEIVGAGPGDPDLVSVRGRKMLEKADLILYAGERTLRQGTFHCASAHGRPLHLWCHSGTDGVFRPAQDVLPHHARHLIFPRCCRRTEKPVHDSRTYSNHHSHPWRRANPHARERATAPSRQESEHHVHLPQRRHCG